MLGHIGVSILLPIVALGTVVCFSDADFLKDLQIIGDPNAKESIALASMERLRLISPSSDEMNILARVTNSSKYPDSRRRRAVLLLFDRHIRKGMELRTAAGLLASPVWLKKTNVFVVRDVTGLIPVRIMPGETVFAVWPRLPFSDVSHVYLRVKGSPSVDSFCNALLGKCSDAGALKITGIGMYSSDDDRITFERGKQ